MNIKVKYMMDNDSVSNHVQVDRQYASGGVKHDKECDAMQKELHQLRIIIVGERLMIPFDNLTCSKKIIINLIHQDILIYMCLFLLHFTNIFILHT
jgi:hypothetical protein